MERVVSEAATLFYLTHRSEQTPGVEKEGAKLSKEPYRSVPAPWWFVDGGIPMVDVGWWITLVG